MSRVRITRQQEIRNDLADLAKKCRLAASETVLDLMAREIEADEKAGLYEWPSKGGKKGGNGNQSIRGTSTAGE
jgi:hypothetical protein